MKKLIILSIIIISFLSCSVGPLAYYNDQPIIKLSDYSSTLSFSIPDIDDNGWNPGEHNEGMDTVSVSMSAYIDMDNKAYITDIEYEVYADGEEVSSSSFEYLYPVFVENGDTVNLEALEIILDERDAYYADWSDDTEDYSGSGIIAINIVFEDIYGTSHKSIPLHIEYSITLP